MILQLIASLVACGGIALLFLTWRRKGVREGLWQYALPAGWALVALGLIGWMASTNPDQGLALGTTTIMMFACVILARQGLMLMGKPSKVQPERESATDTLALGAGYWGRFAVRLIGSLLVVPAAALMVGMVWRAYIPGDEGDRLIALAFIVLGVMTAALTWLLASRKPYRTCGVVAVTGLVAAALVYLPLLGH